MSNSTFEIRDLRNQGWVWTSKALLFDERIDASQFKVYCGLASFADNQTQEAFPSIVTLATRLHLGRSTVIRALAKLDEGGYIKREQSKGFHNVYYLLEVNGVHAPIERIPKGGKEPKPAKIAPGFNPLGAEIVEAFILVNPACKRYYNNVTQRQACDDLIGEYGLEHVLKVVRFLPKVKGINYIPMIKTPLALMEKWAQLEDGMLRMRAEKTAPTGKGIA